MLKTAEAVSVGHPDKIADYISSYILDKLIEQNTYIRYAVEVMIKDNTVVLGGEINQNINEQQLNTYVKDALRQIGYDEKYHRSIIDETGTRLQVKEPKINQKSRRNL